MKFVDVYWYEGLDLQCTCDLLKRPLSAELGTKFFSSPDLGVGEDTPNETCTCSLLAMTHCSRMCTDPLRPPATDVGTKNFHDF